MTKPAVFILILCLAVLILCQFVQYGRLLQTELFPAGWYAGLATKSHNIVTVTYYNLHVVTIAVGDKITVSYVDNR